MLKVTNLETNYGSIKAVKGIDFQIESKEIVSIIGSNGAGKSTLLKSVLGLVKPAKGEIELDGQNIAGLPSHKIINMGISVVPEGREVFGSFTVYENLRMGLKKKVGKVSLNDFEKQLDYVFYKFPRLKERRDQFAGTLSGGEQQMLVISRALISNPKLLMLDEPSLGLAPIIVNEIFDIIKTLKEDGMTILLVEQIANKALSVADRGYVIENGQIVITGTAQELKSNKDIAKAYLGV